MVEKTEAGLLKHDSATLFNYILLLGFFFHRVREDERERARKREREKERGERISE